MEGTVVGNLRVDSVEPYIAILKVRSLLARMNSFQVYLLVGFVVGVSWFNVLKGNCCVGVFHVLPLG